MNFQFSNIKLLNRFSGKRHLLTWVGIVVLVILILFMATIPVRVHSSDNYVKKGDRLLAEKKYLSAEVEYRKALILKPGNNTAKDRLLLVNNASIDVASLESFFSDNGYSKQRDDLKKAEGFPENEVEAVKETKALIEKGEFQLAILPVATTVEMDSEYRDAWLYLGIANLKAAENLEITVTNKSTYLGRAKEALKKAVALDPEYKIASDYAKEAENVKL